MIYYHIWIRRRDYRTPNRWTEYHKPFVSQEENGIAEQVAHIEAENTGKVLEFAGLEVKIVRGTAAKSKAPEI